MASIRRDFLPEDLAPILSTNGVDGCVAVQTDQTADETAFLLRLADAHEFIKGVVGWIDFKSETLVEQLDYYTQYEKLKGFRHIVQAEAVDFLLDDTFIRGVQKLYSFGFTYDLLIYPTQLNAAIQFAQAVPDVPIVLDHLAKPYIRSRTLDTWQHEVTKLASCPNVYCKVSGLVTEADWQHWRPSDFVAYLDVALEAFGPQRLLFGSDWPVCLVAADYAQVLHVLTGYIATLSESEQRQVMGQNALDFYKIDT